MLKIQLIFVMSDCNLIDSIIFNAYYEPIFDNKSGQYLDVIVVNEIEIKKQCKDKIEKKYIVMPEYITKNIYISFGAILEIQPL